MNGPIMTNSPDLIARSSASISAADIVAAVRRIEFDPDLESLHSTRRPAAAARYVPGAVVAAPSAKPFALPVELRDVGVRTFEAVRRPAPPARIEPLGKLQPPQVASLRIVSRRPEVTEPGRANVLARLDLDSPPDACELETISRGAGRPRLAAGLSLAVPGLGHFYAGEWQRALLLSIGFLISASGAWTSPWAAVSLAAGAVAAALWVFAAGDAFAAVLRETPWGRPRTLARPRLAPLASTLIPGWGQFLNDDARKATLFLVALPALAGAFALMPLLPAGAAPGRTLTLALGCIGVVLWALSIYDAGLIASQRSRRRATGASDASDAPATISLA